MSGSVALAVFANINGAVAQTAMGSQTPQQASPVARDFNIPAQPLQSALLTFNRQSGMQITSAANATQQGVRVNTLSGRFTPQQALEKLLAGTGVSFYFTGNGAAVIGERQTVGGAQTLDGSTVLETIVVTGKTDRNAATGSGFQGTPDWVYEAPASVSVVSKEAIENSGARSARDVLDHVAGVQVNRSESQKPGVQVNIRGLQDNNRVVAMIDGARQNFQRAGHGGSQQVFVDSSFIRSVEIEKATGSGVGGAGSLGGSVNFRSVTADDIIKSGEKWGGTITAGSGTNAFDFDGNVIAGIRLSEDFSILGGVSHKRLGEYKVGKRDSKLIEWSTIVGDEVLSTGFESVGSLFKMEATPVDDVKIDLSWMRYDITSSLSEGTRIDDEDYLNNTITSSLSWDPESALVDLKAKLWFSDTKNDEVRNYTIPDPVSYGMRSWGGSIENTSRFELPVGAFSLNYGVEAFRDSGETDAIARINASGIDEAYGYKGMNPSGRADMASGFLNATLEHDDWLTVRGGLRYDHYRLKGATQIAGVGKSFVISPAGCELWDDFDPTFCIIEIDEQLGQEPAPYTNFEIDKSGGAWLPSASISIKPFDWLQPFVNYSESYRPPSIMETLFSGGHPNTSPTANMPNPNLRAEQAKTWELGANIKTDGLLSSDDSFRLKALWFRRDITDYIAMARGYYAPFEKVYDVNVNLDGTTRMRGLELEVNYDIGLAYGGVSYTRTNTDLASTYTYDGPSDINATPGSGNEIRSSVIFVVPKERFSLDAGVRMLDERFVLGGRMTYVQQTQPTVGVLAPTYSAYAYRVYDIYGSYAFNENTKLRFAVNNVTDEAYWPSLGTSAIPAPGRTFTASLSVKF
nr:TonB-dependent hemoglobin/transferrin/lactoferrin family receptor [Agrobacterium sp. rho-13.3]MDX8306325.1 TonB-dependent hemoglobin/transferrin/lactoferrin family receptor [Agrobacterium sp. rho-13.3]MDX8307344.1 TonB-dependent hemoglobin/transferrin/lactoferrin family receptor [Agrobacterium sp. rho-13.3]